LVVGVLVRILLTGNQTYVLRLGELPTLAVLASPSTRRSQQHR
jgi:hypothetical protein